MTDFDDYDELVEFEGEFHGEKVVTQARIHENGDIHFLQGSVAGPDDIVGLNLEKLKEVIEAAEEMDGEEIEDEWANKVIEE